jgi:ubiquinone/menaquinone biosynthesis C-methylase UbiE
LGRVGVYGEQVLPRLMSLMMGTRVLAGERRQALAGVRGAVLEIGFGAGHNLPHYPATVEKVVAVDPSGVGARLARKRIAAAPFPVEHVALRGEAIDAPDASFDAVVSTFTLCTVPDPAAALGQLRRVLKPDGRFFFVEHGRADDPAVRRWQDRLNGLQRALVGGCNLNRDIERLVREAGFAPVEVHQHYLPGMPRTSGFVTRGVATRAP